MRNSIALAISMTFFADSSNPQCSTGFCCRCPSSDAIRALAIIAVLLIAFPTISQAEQSAESASTTSVELKEGQTPQEVESLLGKPQDTITLKENLIYVYPTVKVIFEKGKLVDVQYPEKSSPGQNLRAIAVDVSGQWRGSVAGWEAELVITQTQSQLFGKIAYAGVEETLAGEVENGGQIILRGTSFRRLSGQGSFNLDSFYGQLETGQGVLTGTYVDAAGGKGVWSLSRTATIPNVEGAAAQTVNGWVSDSKCGAKGANAGAAACTKKCIETGASAVVVTDGDNKVLTVDNADALEGHEGHHVAVTGYVKGDSIHVEGVKMLETK